VLNLKPFFYAAILVASFLHPSIAFLQAYKSVDASGKIIFSDKVYAAGHRPAISLTASALASGAFIDSATNRMLGKLTFGKMVSVFPMPAGRCRVNDIFLIERV